MISTDISKRREYLKRLNGIISPAFHEKTILTVGLGAGSYAVEKLARLCPGRLKNCDFDVVEVHNLPRTAYTYADAENRILKTDGMAKRIQAINPFVEVVSYPKSITDLSPTELKAVMEEVHLIFAGTDDFDAQALGNSLSIQYDIPAVFVGVHAKAFGGRVIWSVPGETPCYRCVARERYEAVQEPSNGRMNLDGELGCIIDCQFIDMVAVKVMVAILERGQDSLYGHFYEKMRGRNEIVVRCDPDYEWGTALWNAVLGDLPTTPKNFARDLREEVLFAMDTMWLRTDFDPNCPDCTKVKNDV